MKNKLVIENLRHVYNDNQVEVQVLKDVNATFESGKMYAIVGESGSGKTTLISLLSALDSIQHGDIKYNGESINHIGKGVFRLKYVGIVFQSYNLIKYMTARENVEIALDFQKTKSNEKEMAYEILEKVGINRDEADRLVQKLSGGQQQRVAIARAMACDTPIVVADEPTGNLDEDTEGKILELFKQLADAGKIVIIVTHSQKVARHADAIVYHMRNGVLSKV
ncbi:MAG: ABC transporter ATP-binding protein [Candidatus Nomurabacteria bacterium]|jgi:putative ABC transport system ATP-binding protein|nr:ABC transporter ATP-binding protein [Candidatus Nomurabacteria bacterium]